MVCFCATARNVVVQFELGDGLPRRRRLARNLMGVVEEHVPGFQSQAAPGQEAQDPESAGLRNAK